MTMARGEALSDYHFVPACMLNLDRLVVCKKHLDRAVQKIMYEATCVKFPNNVEELADLLQRNLGGVR